MGSPSRSRPDIRQIQTAGWLVDGVDNNEFTFNTVIVSPSVEQVREFKVLLGVFSAEFGRGAGVVSVSTKSGTNQLRGTAFEFLRNDAFDARNFFVRKTPQADGHVGIDIPARIAARQRRMQRPRFGARRRHSGDDIVEVATPTASVRLHVDSKSAPIAAGIGAGLIDAAAGSDRFELTQSGESAAEPNARPRTECHEAEEAVEASSLRSAPLRGAP